MHFFITLASFGLWSLVSAHCKITHATSRLGGETLGLGLRSHNHDSRLDVTHFLDPTSPLGTTVANGPNNLHDNLAVAQELSAGALLPQIVAGSTLSVTIRQIDENGAGPMHCAIDPSATGHQFSPMQIGLNIPGVDGLSAERQVDLSLEVVVPDAYCSGMITSLGKLYERVCLIKCYNGQGFGGVFAAQMRGAKQASQLELRDTYIDGEVVRLEGKQGNKARVKTRHEATSRRSDESTIIHKQGKQGNKVRSTDATWEGRKEGKQGNKARRRNNKPAVRKEGKQGNKI